MIPAPTRHMFCGRVFCNFNNFFGTAFWVSLPKCSLVWDGVARYVWFSVSNFPCPEASVVNTPPMPCTAFGNAMKLRLMGSCGHPSWDIGHLASMETSVKGGAAPCQYPGQRYPGQPLLRFFIRIRLVDWWGCFGVQNRGTLADQVLFTSTNPCLEEHRHNDDRCII